MVDNKVFGKKAVLREVLPSMTADLVEKLIGKVCENVGAFPELAPVAFIGNVRGAIVCGLDFSCDDAKDFSASQVREMAKTHEADFVMLVSESYALEDASAAHYLANRAQYPTVKSHPDCKECVTFHLDTLAGNFIGRALIEKSPAGVRSVAAPEFIRSDSVEGRFARFLPKPDPKAMH